MKNTNTQIKYPLAYDTKGKIIPIQHVNPQHEDQYICVGCKNPMIPKMGDKNTHHFAHKTEESCAPNTALHETSKAYVVRRFNKAISAKTDYIMKVPCSKCKRRRVKYNLTSMDGAKIKQEMSVFERTRSDLVVFAVLNEQKTTTIPLTIIEIVVTHNLEPNTRAIYLKSNVAIIQIHPSWKNLSKVQSTMNIICQACTTRSRDLANFMSFFSSVQQQQQSNPNSLKEILHDKYGRTIYSSTTRDKINKCARQLNQCGFTQQQSRPTLFMYQSADWKVYADLDSTTVVPIWEFNGALPALYAYPIQQAEKKKQQQDNHPDCKACVLEAIEEKLKQSGIKTGRYLFNNVQKHSH